MNTVFSNRHHYVAISSSFLHHQYLNIQCPCIYIISKQICKKYFRFFLAFWFNAHLTYLRDLSRLTFFDSSCPQGPFSQKGSLVVMNGQKEIDL